MRRERSWTPRRRPGVLGAFLLALFVFGQAYTVFHHSLVEHRVCEVDGQLAHGDDGHAHGDGSEHVEADDPTPTGPVLKTDHGEGEHAEHCSVPTLREERETWHAPRLLDETRGAPRVATALATQVHEPRERRFRLAPKQSPPEVL